MWQRWYVRGWRGRLHVRVSERPDWPVVRVRVPGRPHCQLHRHRGAVLREQQQWRRRDNRHRYNHQSRHPDERRISAVFRDHVRDDHDNVAVGQWLFRHRVLQHIHGHDDSCSGPPHRPHVHRTGLRLAVHHQYGRRRRHLRHDPVGHRPNVIHRPGHRDHRLRWHDQHLRVRRGREHDQPEVDHHDQYHCGGG